MGFRLSAGRRFGGNVVPARGSAISYHAHYRLLEGAHEFLFPGLSMCSCIASGGNLAAANSESSVRERTSVVSSGHPVGEHPEMMRGDTLSGSCYLRSSKLVAVVYGTHRRQRRPQLRPRACRRIGDIREMERASPLRTDCIKTLFLDGKDTARRMSDSLANWGHGDESRKALELNPADSPDVNSYFLAGVFYWRKPGRSPAAGVLSTEASNLAGNPGVSVAVAGARGAPGIYLEASSVAREEDLVLL